MALKIEADLSPIAAGNFVALAECGFYDGVGLPPASCRVRHPGRRPDRDRDGRPRLHDQGRAGDGAYERGTVAMARTADPNSVGSQFFIVLDDEARPALGAANTYQIIGTVTAGMETADAIAAAGRRRAARAIPSS